MKKYLGHFQKNLIAGMVLLCNVAALPSELNPVLYDVRSLSPEYAVAESEDSLIVLEEPETPGDTGASGATEQSEESEDSNKPDEIEEEPEKLDDEELFDFGTDLIIKAINPGYTIDKVSNVGEFIELQNLADTPIALAGYELLYTNSSGNSGLVFTFPEGSYLTSKRLLLRYNKSPEAEESDVTYKGNGLAMSAGPLQLVYNGEVVDEVCWNGKGDCYAAFKNANASGTVFRTTLVRNLTTGEFEHMREEDYELSYDVGESGYYIEPAEDEEEEEKLTPQCQGLEFSEILSYYADSQTEQFIEFFNPTAAEIKLDGCKINYKKKNYDLSGEVGSGKYFAFYLNGVLALTKNPTNPLTLTLIDVNEDVVDEMAYGPGQKKSTSFSKIFSSSGEESWRVTYAITPNVENIFQKFRNCEEGKIINEATGNCVKVSLTNTSATLAACPEGQYRNPLTNRCKKISTSTSSLTPCAEGYERNPETNRCRKITSTNDGADYALVPTTRSDKTIFIGIGIVLMIIVLGLTYIGLQFRHEIARAARVAGQRLDSIRKDLLARCSGRDRNKKS